MRKPWFAPMCIGIMLVFGFAVYSRLPAHVPSHWDVQGTVNDTMPRLVSVLLFPAITAFLAGLLALLPKIDPRKANYAGFTATRMLFVNALALFFVLGHVTILGAALGWHMHVPQLLLAGVGLLLAVLGNEMGRIKPNWFWGIRTPWTLASDRVWQKTHRVGGRLFVLAGLITLVAVFLPPLLSIIITMIAILGGTLYTVLYSYLEWRRLQH